MSAMFKLGFLNKLSEEMEHIYIAGPHGSGKSTLAKRLSKEKKLPILSLDDFYRKGKDGLSEIDKLNRPHIVEGSALFMDKKPRSKDIIILNESKKKLVDRLLRRGWFDNRVNKTFKGEEYRPEASAIIGQSLEDLEEAKRRWKIN